MKKRIESIDLLRAIAMIVMALDHIRDYFHADYFYFDPTDLTKTNIPLFFTRWITHFCAPVFVFLAGTSAFLVGQKKSKKELSAFLFKRGLWLLFLEITVIGFAWSFNPSMHMIRLQVIWALGICMICMSAIIYLPGNVILIGALAILFGHNLLDNIHATGNTFKDFLWAELHQRKRFTAGPYTIATGYPILPWLAIMALGYCFGNFYKGSFDPSKRKKYLLILGTSATLLFILLRSINNYGDMAPWSAQRSFGLTLCSFLNVTKYPPSLMYTLMTLGPAIIFLALSERQLGFIGKIIIPVGRVPLFFYILHLYLLHLLAVILVVISGRPWTEMIAIKNISATDSPWLKGYGLSLAGVYGVWILVIIILYPLCRKYDQYKSKHKEKWWLSYL